MRAGIIFAMAFILWVSPVLGADNPLDDWALRTCLTNCYLQFPPSTEVSDFYNCISDCLRKHPVRNDRLWGVPG